MAYRQPGVTVIQEFLNAVPALAVFALPNVVVGPTFQVETQLPTGQLYSGVSATYAYPEQQLGTVIDKRAADPKDLTSFPVRIFLANTIVRLQQASTGAVNVSNLNQFTDATSNIFANIAVGDVIVVTGSLNGNNGNFTVRSKVDNNTLQTNETFVATEATLTYSVRRNIGLDPQNPLVEIPTSTVGVVVGSTTVTLPLGLTVNYAPFGSAPIISAQVSLSYRALRFDKSADLFEYVSIPALQADFGTDQIVPENTAVFGTYIALLNSPTPTNLLALPKDFLDVGNGTGDELIAYGKAFEVLGLNDIYAIAVMTHNTAVHTALKAHVDGLSDPLKKLERVGIINRQLVLTSVIIDTLTDGAVDNTGLIFTSLSASFLTNGVVPGHFLNISAPSGAKGRYKIASVDSQTQVTLTPVSFGGTIIPGGPLTAMSFFVDKNLQLNEQAAVIAAYAQSLADRRMVITWPDVVLIPSGNQVRQLPGYFLNASVGALTTGLPTQQGLTNLSVAAFVGVRHSTKYFSNDHLNIIADGGVMIFVQDVLDQTPPFIRHQLTTDRSAIKFQEYSVTKNVDFIAKFIRTNHRPFIGQYNIVDSTFDDLKTAAAGNIQFLTNNTKRNKIGGVIRSGKLVSVEQDPANIDSILERWLLNIPIPLNNLDITIAV